MAGVVPLNDIPRFLSRSSVASARIAAQLAANPAAACTQQLPALRNRTRQISHHHRYDSAVHGVLLPTVKQQQWNSSRKKDRFKVRSDATEVARTRQQEQDVATPSSAPTSGPSNESWNPTLAEDDGPDDNIADDYDQLLQKEPMNILERRGAAEAQHPFTHLIVGERWREMVGEKQWEGMLDPIIDDVLRGELIRYGEFAQASYDAFDYQTHSRFCGSCKYSKKRLFQKIGLENRGYEVTDYIYATAGEGVPMSEHFVSKDPDDEESKTDDVWDRESNWIGYIAVTTNDDEIKRLGRRDILVVWRGTVTSLEWLEDMRLNLAPTGLDPRQTRKPKPGVVLGECLKVEEGFLEIYKSANSRSPYTKMSARRQVLQAVIRLVRIYADEELSISITGHSLGSALAQLCAYDIAESGVNQPSKLPDVVDAWDKPSSGRNPDCVVEMTQSEDVKTVPVTVYSFAGPRVGNDAFRDRNEELGVKVLRIVNVVDVVPTLPGLLRVTLLDVTWLDSLAQLLAQLLRPLLAWLESLPWTYTHFGVPLYVDSTKSPFLIKTRNPSNAHNLEGYLHLLSGYHGSRLDFRPAIFRDLALVNKGCDLLSKKYYFPASWWQEENKGLIRTADGCWIPRSRNKEDFPEYDLDDKQDADDYLEVLPPELSSIQ